MNKMTKRILMCAFGVVVCALSVGIFKHASLGIDPFQTLMSGLAEVTPIRYGTLYVIVNAVLLTVSLILDRSRIGIGTLLNLFFFGYIVEFSQKICESLIPDPSLPVRFVLLVPAVILLCFSAAVYFSADLGVSAYDAVSLILADRQKVIPFAFCRVITDVFCVLAGILLLRFAGWSWKEITAVVGIGTILTAFFMGPLIAWFREHVSEPFLEGKPGSASAG